MKRTFRRLLPLLVVSVFARGIALGQTATASAPAIPKGAITPEELRDLIERLASDEFEGRASGEAGGAKAGEFIVEQLKARGVAPFGVGGEWFQPFGPEAGRRGGNGPEGGGSSPRYRNVVGIVRGTDPARRDEYVVLGAHYDHCGKGSKGAGGMGNSGEIHHGADDNGSGTAAVLAIARCIAAQPLPRSVILLLFDAEERGLWGSRAFCREPLVPLEKIQAMVNIDMIGRSYDGYVFVGGIGSSPTWDEIVTKALTPEARLLKNVERSSDSDDRSDHGSFNDKKIPNVFFFTNVHRDYHQPRDTADKIRYKPAASIARASLAIVKGAASMKERMTFTPVGMNGMPKGSAAVEAQIARRAMAMARRLGGLIVPGTDGSPELADTEAAAARAGLEKGDVILAIAKAGAKPAWREVKTVEQLRIETEKFAAGDAVQLRIRRAEKTLVVPTTIGALPEWKYGPATDGGDLPRPPAR